MSRMSSSSNDGSGTNSTSIDQIFSGDKFGAQDDQGITTRAFALNIATGFVLFTLQTTGFFLLKSSGLGRRLYQPKTYLVQERLRVEAIPVTPIAWIKRIFSIKAEELKLKCGLDGYFSIRFLRAMIVIFVPLMALCVTVLLPINFNQGKGTQDWQIAGKTQNYNVTGLDTLSWQNVAPNKTKRYWAHLVCALIAITWTLFRIYREKLHFVKVRQDYLTSPEHRLKASARTILVTNIPAAYRTESKLKELFDVFIDNDDRSKMHVWVNRDYRSLRAMVSKRAKYVHALEKEELRLLRLVNKSYKTAKSEKFEPERTPPSSSDTAVSRPLEEGDVHSQRPSSETANILPSSGEEARTSAKEAEQDALQQITAAFKADVGDESQEWRKYLKPKQEHNVTLATDDEEVRKTKSAFAFWKKGKKSVSKIAWLRAEIAWLSVEIDGLLPRMDDEVLFPRQNSAFIQFDRQMQANMAVALTAHHMPGCMSPRFLDVAPHEIVWANMGLTSFARFIRTCIALSIFVGILILWAIPAFFFGILSQLSSLRNTTKELYWLREWPPWIISFISGPLVAILLALMVQLVVPALCRKLAVLVGAPTRSRRELVTQSFYFTFLFIELVLVTSISAGIFATLGDIIANPVSIPNTLATNLPKAANYFFNYLIIQALAFSGSLLFQYLRVLFITLIWPWFSQTPRQEAWLQTTIPHQMWANVFCIWTNFAAIGMIYSIIAPLMLVFISAVFCLFWIAYRHNYYYVQRNKVDTHGHLFYQALSQILAGVYVLEITLIGLFFLVRNENDNVVCTPQAIIMIVMLALTAAYHYVLEKTMQPLYELLPVTLEDKAAEQERKRFAQATDGAGDELAAGDENDDPTSARPSMDKPFRHVESSAVKGGPEKTIASTAANARRMMLRIHNRVEARLETTHSHDTHHHHLHDGPHRTGTSRKMEVADELGASIARFPDELADLSPAERYAEVRAAYQDPVTREPEPVIWIPADAAGVADAEVERVSRMYRRRKARDEKAGASGGEEEGWIRYSTAGAYLTPKGKVEVTQPAPDVRSDWLLDWVL